jgi:hypothetical protein
MKDRKNNSCIYKYLMDSDSNLRVPTKKSAKTHHKNPTNKQINKDHNKVCFFVFWLLFDLPRGNVAGRRCLWSFGAAGCFI